MDNAETAWRALGPPRQIFDAAFRPTVARFQALWWTPAGDSAWIADGWTTRATARAAFAIWPGGLCPGLRAQGIDLGSSDTPPSHWMIVDRLTGHARFLPIPAALTLTRTSNAGVEPLTLAAPILTSITDAREHERAAIAALRRWWRQFVSELRQQRARDGAP